MEEAPKLPSILRKLNRVVSALHSARREGQVTWASWVAGRHLLLTVGIQECEHLCLRHAGPQQPCSDQPLPLLLPHHPYDLQLLHILLQLLLQVLWKGQGHCYQFTAFCKLNPLWAPSLVALRSPAHLNANCSPAHDCTEPLHKRPR